MTVKDLFESPLWRHSLTVGMLVLTLGIIWGTTKADVERLKDEQSDIETTVKTIVTAAGKTAVDTAVAKQQLYELNRRMDGIDRKLDTLIWRTSPRNPRNPYYKLGGEEEEEEEEEEPPTYPNLGREPPQSGGDPPYQNEGN